MGRVPATRLDVASALSVAGGPEIAMLVAAVALIHARLAFGVPWFVLALGDPHLHRQRPHWPATPLSERAVCTLRTGGGRP